MSRKAPMPRRLRHELLEALNAARMERAEFSKIGPAIDSDLPKSEAEVTDFIRQRTKLYRETWIIPRLEDLLAWAQGDD